MIVDSSKPLGNLQGSKAVLEAQVHSALRDIFEHYGYTYPDASVSAKEEIIVMLNKVADRHWGWRYLHNVIGKHLEPGQEFASAVLRLASMIDGLPIEVAAGNVTTVVAVGKVHPGALIFTDSVKCGYLPCPIHFVPRQWNHRFHSAECRKLWQEEQRDGKKT
jgi:hypothetical protein